MQKKILFISYALPPYLYPQSIQIGRFLNDLKKIYDIHILCAVEDIAQDKTLYPDIFAGIESTKILTVPFKQQPRLNYLKNRFLPLFFNRPDVYTGWAAAARQACIKKFPDISFDVIATFSFPLSLNLLGRELKRHYQCPWIAHQSDPWANNPFMHYGPLTRLVNKALEKKCFKDADKLIFTSIEAAGFYKRRYPHFEDKIDFINHSYDPALYQQHSESPHPKKIIRYIGGFYGDRTAKPLLETLAKLPETVRNNLRFEIVGANLKTKLLIQRAGLPASLLESTGRVSYAESLRLMRESDALLVIDAPIKEENIFFPSKLADYIGADRPIVGVSCPGPTDRILKSLGYQCFDHSQIDALARVFEQISAGKYKAGGDFSSERALYENTVNSRKLSDIIDHV
jgi:glycosyltransferase involved in cell wall biosynthesis